MDLPTSKPFSPSMLHSETERWICIYPVYINSRASRAIGRKINKNEGVDNPKHTEICSILQNIGLNHIAENKVYPRERDPVETQNRWRIRVQLKNESGLPCNAEYPTRHSLLLYLGKTIPFLKTRHGGTEQGKALKKGKRR